MSVSASVARPTKARFDLRRLGQGKMFAWTLVIPCIVILLITALWPTLYVLVLSFSQAQPGEPLEFVGLQNFFRTFQEPRFWHGLYVTAWFVIFSVAAQLVIGFGLALVLQRINTHVRQLATTIFLVPMMIAPAVVGVLWKAMYKERLGPVNYLLEQIGIQGPQWLTDAKAALAGLMIADIWEWTPFMAILLLAGLQSLHGEIYEAAFVDGSTPWQAFKNMTLPLMKPFIFLAVFLRMIDAWKAFDLIFAVTRGGPGDATESIAWYTYKVGFTYFDTGLAAAMSVVQLLIIIVMGRILLSQLSRVEQETRA